MKLGIMQPYFFPYIGYFQLMNAVDEFVVYDNIEFTKKGWINRNRILSSGEAAYFTVPLRKDSDYLHVSQRYISATWKDERKRVLNRIYGSYRKAPFLDSVYPLIETCFNFEEENLFRYIYNSIEKSAGFLKIRTPMVVSSTIDIDHSLKAACKVIALCHARKADHYINSMGGIDLYDREQFFNEGIDLRFIKTGMIVYRQTAKEFVPSLSIIDVMMFNSPEVTAEFLRSSFEII